MSNAITRMAQPPDPLALLVWASLVPPLPLLGLSLAVRGAGGDRRRAGAASTPPLSAALLFVACASGPVRLRGLDALLKRHTAAAVTPFALLVPVFGIASAALLLGERPSALELGGAVLICAGLAATLIPPRAAAPAPAPGGRDRVSRARRMSTAH